MILALDNSDTTVAVSDRNFCSSIIPVLTTWASRLADYLLEMGYPVVPMTYPGVVKEWPRIRVITHAGNTEGEIDSFIYERKSILIHIIHRKRQRQHGNGSTVCRGKSQKLAKSR